MPFSLRGVSGGSNLGLFSVTHTLFSDKALSTMRHFKLRSSFCRLMTGVTVLVGSLAHSQVVYEGTEGPGKGKHIVLLAGDHEYRSEETVPALARILAKHHGFKCSVVFSVNEESGEVDPGANHMPGLEALETADAALFFLRFRDLPKDQMQHILDYMERGGPIMGLRTSTHAFKIKKDKPLAKYSFDYKGEDYKGGWGEQVLGQTWEGHYGKNHRQSTRLSIIPGQSEHPILRGVKDIWVQAGGYVGKPVDGVTTLTMAQPLNGMKQDSPADPEKAPVPAEWTRSYTSASGQEGRVFTSLYGASEDLLDPGYRRMLVNATFWTVGLEEEIKPDFVIDFVGPYHPNSFTRSSYSQGWKPEDYAGFESRIPGSKATSVPKKKK